MSLTIVWFYLFNLIAIICSILIIFQVIYFHFYCFCFYSNIIFSCFNLFLYISFLLQGNIWQQILSFHFILELITTIPFALTVSENFTDLKINTIFKISSLILDIMAAFKKFIYTHIPKLLVSKTFSREHVRKYYFGVLLFTPL